MPGRWATIMLSTVMIRGALLPLIVVQQRNVAGMAKIKPQLDPLIKSFQVAV